MSRYVKFGLIVTGKGEAQFLPRFFRTLTSEGVCTFEVIRWIGQLSPVGEKKRLRMVGRGQKILDKDEELGLVARKFIRPNPCVPGTGEAAPDTRDRFVLLIDDLERARLQDRREVFARYRRALDTMLGVFWSRASVHFLVNMLEAYYFAHGEALTRVLGDAGLLRHPIDDHEGDVEALRHPKNELKKLAPGFDEVRHGQEIVAAFDLERVLSRPDTCGSLRALFAWCMKQMGQPFGARFCLNSGVYDIVTGPLLADDYRSLSSGT